MTAWQQWLEHPERLRIRSAIFQLHLWIGAALSMYVFLVSVTGSVVVFRNELSRRFFVQRLVDLHTSLGAGETGRIVNGFGAVCVTLLVLTGIVIWWPGVQHWRRSLKVNYAAHFARITWDFHSAFGFWTLPLVLVWAVTGVYFAFPQLTNVFYRIDPNDRFTDPALFWLAQLHFGRFNIFTEVLWSVLGLVPAALAFTGVFICCRRIMFQKPSRPDRETDSNSLQVPTGR